MRQNKISKLSSDFSSLNDAKSKISMQLLLVEKERKQFKTDCEKAEKELTLAQITNNDGS